MSLLSLLCQALPDIVLFCLVAKRHTLSACAKDVLFKAAAPSCCALRGIVLCVIVIVIFVTFFIFNPHLWSMQPCASGSCIALICTGPELLVCDLCFPHCPIQTSGRSSPAPPYRDIGASQASRCRPVSSTKAQLWGEFGLDLPSATVLPREEEHAVSTIIRKHQDAKDIVHVLQKRQLEAVSGICSACHGPGGNFDCGHLMSPLPPLSMQDMCLKLVHAGHVLEAGSGANSARVEVVCLRKL